MQVLRIFFFAFVMLLATEGRHCSANAQGVLILVGEDALPHKELAQSLQSEITRDTKTPVHISNVDASDTELTNAKLIITIGSRAVRRVILENISTPIIATLIPRAAYERTINGARHAGQHITAVYLDQPVSRQLSLITVALPHQKRLGILYSTESEQLIPALQAAAEQSAQLKLNIQKISYDEELHVALQNMLSESDVLLALPDRKVFNANTITHILLSSYRNDIPVVGFSPAYIKAGAVLALYSTPSQLAIQTAEIARTHLNGSPLPPPQFPKLFEIAINRDVANSLKLELPDPTVLHDRLTAVEAR